jgi:hypothetical protein
MGVQLVSWGFNSAGLSLADLAAVPQPRQPVPTFAEYVPGGVGGGQSGTRRAYGSYWNRVVDQ